MEKDHNYSQPPPMPPSFNTTLHDYPLDLYPQNQHEELIKFRIGGENNNNNNEMVMDYNMPQTQPPSTGFYGGTTTSFDKLSFADVVQFADFGPKLALNQSNNKNCSEESGIDPVYFLKFPVLNDKMEDQNLMGDGENDERFNLVSMEDKSRVGGEEEEEGMMIRDQDEETTRVVSDDNNSVQQQHHEKNIPLVQQQQENKKRKRPRTVKTSEEVESQRMTHIAVERNRRKQMNEHLRVLRSLMPGSYVQRGDQASIIGGAIEFVRELEQLLQCLESQKRRRLLGEAQSRQQVGDSSALASAQQQQPPFFPPLALPNDDEQMKLVELESSGLREETAESKSCLADVEVKLLGFDAMIKILSRRRPGQLIKTIAALEDLQLIILHTNITTIEQTVLYSFNVKVASDSRFTAEDIASSVQQILSFIHANTSM